MGEPGRSGARRGQGQRSNDASKRQRSDCGHRSHANGAAGGRDLHQAICTDYKYTRFFGAIYTFLGSMWLCVILGMYVVSGQLYTHGLIEARWLLSPILFTGLTCFGLQRHPRSTAMICSVAVLGLFSAAGSLVSLVVYCANLHKIIVRHMAAKPSGAPAYHLDAHKVENSLTHEAHRTEKRFVQLAVGLILIAFFALMACIGLFWHLWDVGRRSHTSQALTLGFKRNLLLSTACLVLLSVFNLTLIGNLLSFQKLAFLQFYAVQDMLCTACLLLTVVGSITLLTSFRGVTTNAIICYILLAFYTCQILHEIHATWGAYYVALFMQRSLHGLHQLMIPLNFLCHIVRMFLCAYLALGLYVELRLPLARHTPFCLDAGVALSPGVQRLLRAGSGVCLVLGIGHALLDVFYTSMHDLILRSLLAFSGASIFYATLAGISLSLYYRYRYAICLIVAESLLVLWAVCGLHNVYTYISLTYTYVLATPPDNLDIHHPAYLTPAVLHFLEALVSVAGIVASGTLLFLIMRLCYLGKRSSGGGSSFVHGYSSNACHTCIKIAVIAMTITTLARLLITNSAQSEWNIFDVNLIHGGRDILLDLVLLVALAALACPRLASGDHGLADFLPSVDPGHPAGPGAARGAGSSRLPPPGQRGPRTRRLPAQCGPGKWNLFDGNLIHGGRDILLDLVLLVALAALACPRLASGDHGLADFLPSVDPGHPAGPGAARGAGSSRLPPPGQRGPRTRRLPAQCGPGKWNLFDGNLIHGGRDILLDLVLLVALAALACPRLASGDHGLADFLPSVDPAIYWRRLFVWLNTFCMLLLLMRVITTMHSLDMETAYLQLLIFYTRAATPAPHDGKGRNVFTRPHLAALTANHAMELIHWALDVGVLVVCCVLQEHLFRHLARNPTGDTPLFTTDTPMESFQRRQPQPNHQQPRQPLVSNGIHGQQPGPGELTGLGTGIENPVYDPTNAASKLIANNHVDNSLPTTRGASKRGPNGNPNPESKQGGTGYKPLVEEESSYELENATNERLIQHGAASS